MVVVVLMVVGAKVEGHLTIPRDVDVVVKIEKLFPN